MGPQSTPYRRGLNLWTGKTGEGSMTRKLLAEFIGAAWLVLGGCGAAVLAAAFPHPRHQHVGESCPQHGTGPVRWGLGAAAAVAVLGRAPHRRRARRLSLPMAEPRCAQARSGHGR